MATNYVTHAEQDDLISYLDTKFERIDNRFTAERAYNDMKFAAADQRFASIEQKLETLTTVVISFAETVQQNSADIRRIETKLDSLSKDVRAITSSIDKLITTVAALVKIAPPTKFARAYAEVEEERDTD